MQQFICVVVYQARQHEQVSKNIFLASALKGANNTDETLKNYLSSVFPDYEEQKERELQAQVKYLEQMTKTPLTIRSASKHYSSTMQEQILKKFEKRSKNGKT